MISVIFVTDVLLTLLWTWWLTCLTFHNKSLILKIFLRDRCMKPFGNNTFKFRKPSFFFFIIIRYILLMKWNIIGITSVTFVKLSIITSVTFVKLSTITSVTMGIIISLSIYPAFTYHFWHFFEYLVLMMLTQGLEPISCQNMLLF